MTTWNGAPRPGGGVYSPAPFAKCDQRLTDGSRRAGGCATASMEQRRPRLAKMAEERTLDEVQQAGGIMPAARRRLGGRADQLRPSFHAVAQWSLPRPQRFRIAMRLPSINLAGHRRSTVQGGEPWQERDSKRAVEGCDAARSVSRLRVLVSGCRPGIQHSVQRFVAPQGPRCALPC